MHLRLKRDWKPLGSLEDNCFLRAARILVHVVRADTSWVYRAVGGPFESQARDQVGQSQSLPATVVVLWPNRWEN